MTDPPSTDPPSTDPPSTDAPSTDVPTLDPQEALALARFGSDGLLTAVVQEESTRQVLMVGYMDREALRRTLTEGRAVFWSRSRQEYWRKGDTSGHVQYVRGAALDCDADALLLTVEQVGAACHTGAHACFDTHPVQAGTDEHSTGAHA